VLATKDHNPVSFPTSVTRSSSGATHAALNLDPTGAPLSFRSALAGPNSKHWFAASDTELSKLIDSNCMHPILARDIPADRKLDVTYYNQKMKEKLLPDGSTQRRVRGTAGGDRIHYPDSVAAYTAEMELVKIHWHSVISDHRIDSCTKYMTMDLSDFYIGAPLLRPEYLRIHISKISPSNLTKHQLTPFVHNNHVTFEVNKCLWGLPQAGLLSQQRLVSHLALHGYLPADPAVPCYFKHVTRSLTFTLVIDDFGVVKYQSIADVEHLKDTIRLLYPKFTENWNGDRYLQFHLHWNYPVCSLSYNLPDYIPKALERFRHNEILQGASTPALYIPPFFARKSTSPLVLHPSQRLHEDNSRPCTPAELTYLQQVIGVYLYYARAVDCTMLTAVNHLSSMLASATQHTLDCADRLIRYSASYPNHCITMYGCDMQLFMQSDASYLTRPNARSVAGGIAFLGNHDDLQPHSGPLFCCSSIIPTVCSSAAEAEYAALFHCAKSGIWLRTILTTMGYTQRAAIPLQCDNAVAVGIANQTVKPKMSKAIDMRYHWIRDQVSQNTFRVYWQRGADNLADFFTKALPVQRHQELKCKFVSLPPNPTNPALNRRARANHVRRLARLLATVPSPTLS
jgi:hypothetical protein